MILEQSEQPQKAPAASDSNTPSLISKVETDQQELRKNQLDATITQLTEYGNNPEVATDVATTIKVLVDTLKVWWLDYPAAFYSPAVDANFVPIHDESRAKVVIETLAKYINSLDNHDVITVGVMKRVPAPQGSSPYLLVVTGAAPKW